jgi:uncharacterized membrane protein
MAKGGLRLWHLVVIVILAALIGTALGDLLLQVAPGSSVAGFLASGFRLGTSAPLDVDFKVAQLTFGAGIRFTVLGGLLAAMALLLFVRRAS